MANTKIPVELSSTPGIVDNSDATAITIDSSERVNIGKTSATTGHPVEIQANTAGQGMGIYGRSADDFSFLGFYENGANTELSSLRSNSTFLATNIGGSERMRVTSDGDLLVRQTSADVYDTNTGGTVRQYWGNQFSASNNTNSRVIIGSGSNAALVGGATVNSGGTRPIVNSYISFGSTSQTAGSEAGMVQFYTSTGGATGAVRARIDSDGLKFGSDTAADSALDDYEEGEWVPAVSGGTSAGTTTHTHQNGQYVKVGELVSVTCFVRYTAATGSGYLKLTGLPYAIGNRTQNYPVAATIVDGLNWGGGTYIQALSVPGLQETNFYYMIDDANAGRQDLTNETVAIRFTMTYRT